MKLWIDDVRPAPNGYIWVKTVNKAKSIIAKHEPCRCGEYEKNYTKKWMDRDKINHRFYYAMKGEGNA